MTTTPIPLLILAGSDGRGGPVPVDLTEQDMLRGYKGALSLPGGKILVQELIDRLSESGYFEPILVLGPSPVYARWVDREVIHVSGPLPVMFEQMRQTMYTRFDPELPIAVCASDILPTSEEIRLLMEQDYRPHAASCFWWQLIHAEQNRMGESDWKQAYRLRMTPESEIGNFYPGHLVILRPASIRLRLASTLLALSYRYRNKLIQRRFLPMALRGGLRFLREDFLNLFRGQWPTLTWTVFSECLRGLHEYRNGRLTVAGFAERLGRLIVHRRFRQPGMPPAVVFSPVETISLAKDIDSHRELKELVATLKSPPTE